MPLGIIVVIVLIALLIMANAFMAGYTYGLYKTLSVHKSVDTVDKPKEFNQSLAPLLPPEVQEYYNITNGQNRY